jgi:hypothetical protein
MERTASALRAQWLAELADAIESAQSLAWQLGTEDRTSGEARKLFARLEAARLELESIRSGGIETVWTAESEWLQKLGWPCGAETPPG